MGVTLAPRAAYDRLALLLHPRLRALGWATLVANGVLVVTGGAVRLTGSGLGCPTWPRCDADSFTPHGANGIHQQIEFGNRTLTFVLAAIAVATFVAAQEEARRTGRGELRTLALVLGLAIPAQAVIGGISVRTHLNPWVVSFHLLISLAMIGVAVVFLRRIDHSHPVRQRGPVVGLAWATFAAGSLLVLVAWGALGTVLTAKTFTWE